MEFKESIIVLSGPTASGKTALAIKIAKKLGAHIINADSRQIYKELNIAVAKPTEDELSQVPHYFVSSHSIFNTHISAGDYAKIATQKIKELQSLNIPIVITGGTGFYLSALLHPLTIEQSQNFLKNREFVRQLFAQNGLQAVINKLNDMDPSLIIGKDVKNTHRILRLLEINMANKVQNHKEMPFNYNFYTINLPRTQLYERINNRVDSMVANGLVEEAKLMTVYTKNVPPTVGYAEIFNYLNKEYSLDFAIDKIKQHSRNYAKRQLTYLKNQFINSHWDSAIGIENTIFAT